jgi:hypothetical protein
MPALPRTVIKHPGSSYLVVAFLAVCVTALLHSPLALLLYLLPLAVAFYVARTATVVDETGLTARAPFGSAHVGWGELRGLRLDPSGAVYAVSTANGQVRLPCVRSTRLERLIQASAGRIPDPAR